MGRRQKNSARGRRKNNPQKALAMGGNDVFIPFRYLYTFSPSMGALTLSDVDLAPSSLAASGSRISVAASLYEMFRFTRLKINATCSVQPVMIYTGSALSSAGLRMYISYFQSGLNDLATPGTALALAQADAFRHSGGGRTVRLALNKKTLMGKEHQWFRTNSGNSPPYDEVQQGSVWVGVDSDATYSGVNPLIEVLIEGICEFRGMTNNAIGFNSPPPVSVVVQRAAPAIMSKEVLSTRDDDEKKSDDFAFVQSVKPITGLDSEPSLSS